MQVPKSSAVDTTPQSTLEQDKPAKATPSANSANLAAKLLETTGPTVIPDIPNAKTRASKEKVISDFKERSERELNFSEPTTSSSLYQNLPEELRNDPDVIIAALNNSLSLKHIENHLITLEVCKTAIQANPWNIEYIPSELTKIKDLYDLALKNGDDLVLQFVPDEFKTAEVCMKAVENTPLAMEFCPEKFITEEMCKKAVISVPLALKRVPTKFKTLEICALALSSIPNSRTPFFPAANLKTWIPEEYHPTLYPETQPAN